MTEHYADHAPLVGRSFTDDGLPTGVGNMVENTLAVAKDYYVTALPGEQLIIRRLLVHIIDLGKFQSSKYGVDLVLANGVKPYLMRASGPTAGVRHSLASDDPIFTNPDWGGICFDKDLSNYGNGSQNESMSVRWSFYKYSKGVTLNEGDQIGFHLQDDFTALIHHHVIAQGVHLKTPNPAWQIVV
jgi:hypothetical protein